MSNLLNLLKLKERRGSKPRCHFLTHGTAEEVAGRLTALITPFGHVSASDRWMPQGFVQRQEAQLHKAPRLLNPDIRARLAAWWLPAGSEDLRTPNFDIASTCTIGGVPGLLLVEAKAHCEELNKEAVGRKLPASSSDGRKASHKTIFAAIDGARAGLEDATSLPWHISRDRCYQMSNRFAWSWKLTELGVPVILVYLGFLRAEDMCKPGEVPFAGDAEWDALVRSHSEPLFPAEVWNRRWTPYGQAFIPLIRAIEKPLEAPHGEQSP